MRAMRISLPVWVRTPAGDVVVPLEMRERTATATATLPAAALLSRGFIISVVLESGRPRVASGRSVTTGAGSPRQHAGGP